MTLENGHLNLPSAALLPRNELKLTFASSNVAPAGKAFTRYEDRDDHNEYIYTLFVPDGRQYGLSVFRPKPDLKARFSLYRCRILYRLDSHRKYRPFACRIGRRQVTTTTFPDTHPISTVPLCVSAAGPLRVDPRKTSRRADCLCAQIATGASAG